MNNNPDRMTMGFDPLHLIIACDDCPSLELYVMMDIKRHFLRNPDYAVAKLLLGEWL